MVIFTKSSQNPTLTPSNISINSTHRWLPLPHSNDILWRSSSNDQLHPSTPGTIYDDNFNETTSDNNSSKDYLQWLTLAIITFGSQLWQSPQATNSLDHIHQLTLILTKTVSNVQLRWRPPLASKSDDHLRPPTTNFGEDHLWWQLWRKLPPTKTTNDNQLWRGTPLAINFDDRLRHATSSYQLYWSSPYVSVFFSFKIDMYQLLFILFHVWPHVKEYMLMLKLSMSISISISISINISNLQIYCKSWIFTRI